MALAGAGCDPLLDEAARLRAAIAARTLAEAKAVEKTSLFRRPRHAPWPGAAWANQSLAGLLAGKDADSAAHLAGLALTGRGADPFLAGSAVHALGAGAGAARIAGGLAMLGSALRGAAEAAGVTFSFGLEASDIHRRDGRILGIGLADGSEIAARSIVSTLDAKRTFLNFFPWNALPKPVVRRVSAFRLAGSTARVLFAVERIGDLDLPEGPLHIAPSLEALSAASQAWRNGVVAETLPITLAVPSRHEPALAPYGSATVTATLGAVPFRLFDGAWTHEKRELLRRRTLGAVEAVIPGFSDRVLGSEVVAPPDIEDALGATDGDLLGGEIAGDQMLGTGPWAKPALPRTPIAGLYLAGSNLTASAFATCAAGAAAAHALIADRGRSR